MYRILGSFALAAALLRAGTTVDNLINRVQTRYNPVRTLSVEFVETYSMQGHPRPSEQGRLLLRKQGKMRWDYTNPAGKLFVSDGKSVYLYSAGDNRVEKVSLKDTEDMRVPLAFLLGHLDMKKEFRDFSVQQDAQGLWLDAHAKSDRLPYESVRMLIGPEGSVRRLQVAGRDESLLAFSFSDERVNPPLADAVFHFTVPAGAEVVNSVEFAGGEK